MNPNFNKYVLPQNLDQNGDPQPYTEGVLLKTNLANTVKIKGVIFNKVYLPDKLKEGRKEFLSEQGNQKENYNWGDNINDYPVNGSGNLFIEKINKI